MKPTVGRIVHFHDTVNHVLFEDRDLGPPIAGPFMALVLAVIGDEGDVVLKVEFPDGVPARVSLRKHAADDKPTPGCWNWPPRE